MHTSVTSTLPTPVSRQLVGRSSEVAKMRAFLNTNAGPRWLVIEGEAGIGKTRLVDHWVASDPSTDRVSWLRCSHQAPSPVEAFHRMLEGVFPTATAEVVVSHLDRITGPFGSSDADASVERMRQTSELAELVVASVAEQPLLLVVDDLHWIHPLAMRFLESLFRESVHHHPAGLAVVLTTRHAPTEHPAAALLDDIDRSPLADRLSLGSLDEAACDDLIREQVTDPSAALQSFVRRSARGNPLRMRAALSVVERMGREGDPTLRTERRLQTIRFDDADPVVVWMDQLDAEDRSLLMACALIDVGFAVELAAKAANRSMVDVDSRLTRLTRRGVLVTDGYFHWFSHPQLREVLQDAVSPLVRSEVHARCAEALAIEAGEDTDVDVASLGWHVLESGQSFETLDTVSILTQAGHSAMSLTSWADAARFFAAALDRGDCSSASADSALHQGLGQALYFDADVGESERHFREAMRLAQSGGDDQCWCDSLVSLLRLINSRRRESLHASSGHELVAEFLSRVDAPLLRSRVLQVQAEAFLFAGEVDAGREAAREALALAGESDDPLALALGHYAVAYAAMTAAEVPEALHHSELALSWAIKADDWYIESGVRARRAFIVLASGDLDEAAALSTSALQSSRRQHEYSGQALAGAILTTIATLRGDFVGANELFDDAASAARRSEYQLAGFFLGPAGVALGLLSDDPLEAQRRLGFWALPKQMAGPLRDLTEVALGHRAQPSRTAAKPRPPTLVDAATVASRAQLGTATRSHELAAAVLSRLEAYDSLAVMVPPGYPVLIPRLLGDVYAELGREEQAVAAFTRAVALAERSGAVVEEAHALVGLASVVSLTAADGHDRAQQLATRAIALAERLGLSALSSRARAIRGAGIDSPIAVSARGGTWYVILATDLVGSTRVSNDEGDEAYYQLVQEHHSTVERVVVAHGGQVWSDSGDGLYSFFTATSAAVQAARAIQAEFALHRRSPSSPQVKIALGGGEPLFTNDRPYGLVVNRTAHVLNNAVAGEIIVDEIVAAALERSEFAGAGRSVDLKAIGPHLVRPLRLTGNSLHTPTIDMTEVREN